MKIFYHSRPGDSLWDFNLILSGTDLLLSAYVGGLCNGTDDRGNESVQFERAVHILSAASM